MTEIVYRIVEHDGGWAYMLGSTYSETYPNRETALAAAVSVANEQKVPAESKLIEFETSNGEWRVERADGGDRSEVSIQA